MCDRKVTPSSLIDHLSCAKVQLAAVHQTKGVHRLDIGENVLCGIQIGHDGEFLVDHPYAPDLGLVRVMEHHILPFQKYFSGSGTVHPAQDMHEGGLPRAILPDERVHLAATHPERHAIERFHPGESLGDAIEL